ncbi:MULTISPECIES: tyrosine-type recombinase/integrase [Streptomyces]|uniref:tyrosine-type recombinase/integrase n=1 Tax=Streptomyces TaxID=1883 RepID=UPI0035318B5D
MTGEDRGEGDGRRGVSGVGRHAPMCRRLVGSPRLAQYVAEVRESVAVLLRCGLSEERLGFAETLLVKPPQWFTADQAQSILDGLAPARRTMCLLGFYTGLRWGELSGLHRHRIDVHHPRLFVVEVNTKSGSKEYPKSSRSRREVPLPPHVLEALERHSHQLDHDAVVFTTMAKGR